MTTDRALRLLPAADLLARVLLWVTGLRFVVAAASGFVAIAHDQYGPAGAVRTGDIIATFAGAGDGVGLLLLLLVVALLWTVRAVDDSPDATRARRWRTRGVVAAWLLALAALSALLYIVGISVEAAAAGASATGRIVQITGFSAVQAVAALGAVAVVRGLLAHHDAAGRDDPAAAVFAVDRRTTDVLAWPSLDDALLRAPVYGVEEEEYDFYLDDGTVLDAGLDADGRVALVPTETDRFDELVRHLRAYAQRRGIEVATENADEPLAYVDPISRWHWLQTWPGWLRWMGHIARPPR